MNTETQVTTSTDPHAGGPPTSVAQASTATATSPANQQRPLSRRERGKPVYHPIRVYPSTNPEAKTKALALENLPLTESSFPEMIDRVLVQPLNTKFRAFLQRLFDAASRAAIEKEAAEKETPLPVFKPTKPGNGTPHEMPEIDCKPPLPQRPSSRDWRSQ